MTDWSCGSDAATASLDRKGDSHPATAASTAKASAAGAAQRIESPERDPGWLFMMYLAQP